jgi:hypothetical protein
MQRTSPASVCSAAEIIEFLAVARQPGPRGRLRPAPLEMLYRLMHRPARACPDFLMMLNLANDKKETARELDYIAARAAGGAYIQFHR